MRATVIPSWPAALTAAIDGRNIHTNVIETLYGWASYGGVSAGTRHDEDGIGMDFFRHFTFLICAPAFDVNDLEGLRLQQIATEVERAGFQVVKARRVEDAELAIRTDAAIGCMIIDWSKKGLDGKTAALIELVRRRGLETPIMLLVRRQRFENIPVDVPITSTAMSSSARKRPSSSPRT